MPELKKGTHRDIEKYYPLMQMDFDSEELFGKYRLHRSLTEQNAELLIMRDEESGMDLAYAYVIPRGIYGYVLLKYMGVLPWYRDKGVGIDLMRLINKRYADKQGIIAEITDFEDADPDHQKKLKKFFSRFGYSEAERCCTVSGTDSHVFIKPIKSTQDITPYLHRILPDLYSRVIPASAVSEMLAIGEIKQTE